MTKVDHRGIIFLLACFLFAACFIYPDFLNDENTFLKEFVGTSLLSVLGFITAVTIASANSIHLHLNNLADKTTKRFNGVKSALMKSVVSLICVFGVAVALVVVKPMLPSGGIWVALANSLSVVLILFDLSIMLDLSRTVLKIPPAKDIQ